MSASAGTSFQAASVVDLYRHRPPYPAAIYSCIQTQAPARKALLDLGCGEGKIARPMARVFDQVVAVDPSAKMIALGKTLENGMAPNLAWVKSTAQNAPLCGPFDVVTFASSIHWMPPEQLFPKLRHHLAQRHILAILQGDEPFQPAWHADWRMFLAKWVPEITGRPLDSDAWRGARTRHLDFVDVVQQEAFVSAPFTQTVEDFILCQHSRDTFALAKLGPRRAAFQQELAEVLRPYADAQGQLTFQVHTDLTLATLKAAPPA